MPDRAPSVTCTTPDSYSRIEGIFTVGAVGVGGAPTVCVLGPQPPLQMAL